MINYIDSKFPNCFYETRCDNVADISFCKFLIVKSCINLIDVWYLYEKISYLKIDIRKFEITESPWKRWNSLSIDVIMLFFWKDIISQSRYVKMVKIITSKKIEIFMNIMYFIWYDSMKDKRTSFFFSKKCIS